MGDDAVRVIATTGAVAVNVTEADLVESAVLVAVMTTGVSADTVPAVKSPEAETLPADAGATAYVTVVFVEPVTVEVN